MQQQNKILLDSEELSKGRIESLLSKYVLFVGRNLRAIEILQKFIVRSAVIASLTNIGLIVTDIRERILGRRKEVAMLATKIKFALEAIVKKLLNEICIVARPVAMTVMSRAVWLFTIWDLKLMENIQTLNMNLNGLLRFVAVVMQKYICPQYLKGNVRKDRNSFSKEVRRQVGVNFYLPFVLES